MKRFVMTFIVVYIVWIFLIHNLNPGELLIGAGISVMATLVTWEFFTEERHKMIFNPLNWIRALKYLVIFIYLEILSHIDVAKMIITGNIKPAIVGVKTKFKTDLGKTMLANSITLTPGTLTLEIDKNTLYVHSIYYRSDYQIGKLFEKHGLKVTG